MVTYPIFPKCPIRNVLSRLCESACILVLHAIDINGASTTSYLCHTITDESPEDIRKALRTLTEDGIIEKTDDTYTLSSLGKSFLPLMNGFTEWCETLITKSRTSIPNHIS